MKGFKGATQKRKTAKRNTNTRKRGGIAGLFHNAVQRVRDSSVMDGWLVFIAIVIVAISLLVAY